MDFRPRQLRGSFAWQPDTYGRSRLGAPLEVFRPRGACAVLIFAGIHGDEPETTSVLSWALRHLNEPSPHCAVVLAANPDGLLRGTRANAAGVDLNRNFPAANWSPDPVAYRVLSEHPRDVALSPGEAAGSEPEVRALMDLVAQLQPRTRMIALHAPLACIEEPQSSDLGRWLATESKLPLVDDVGYHTPGSFGSWAPEHDRQVITYELPVDSGEQLQRLQAPVFVDLLTREDL